MASRDLGFRIRPSLTTRRRLRSADWNSDHTTGRPSNIEQARHQNVRWLWSTHYEGAKDSVDETADAVTHPERTVKGLAHAVTIRRTPSRRSTTPAKAAAR